MNTAKELFIFPDAARDLPEVDEWFSGETMELYSIARHWFAKFRPGQVVDSLVLNQLIERAYQDVKARIQ